MLLNDKQQQNNLDYVKNFNPKKYTVTKFSKMEKTNELILIESKF